MCEGFLVSGLEVVFFWLPILRTTEVLANENNERCYKYMHFWCLFGLLLSIEFLSFQLLFLIPFYRLIRLVLLIWIQLDDCKNSVKWVDVAKPFVNRHSQLIEAFFEFIESSVRRLKQITGSLFKKRTKTKEF